MCGIYSCYIKNLHVGSKPFCDVIRDFTSCLWTHEHENIFQMIKDRISVDTTVPISSIGYLFRIHVGSSNVGTDCILIRQFAEGKRNESFNSWISDKAEQKMSIHDRELCGFVFVLQTYEHYINGSFFHFACNVPINPSPIYDDAKNRYRIASLDIKIYQQNSRS